MVRGDGNVGSLFGPCHLMSGVRRKGQCFGGPTGGPVSPMRRLWQADCDQSVPDLRRHRLGAYLRSGIDKFPRPLQFQISNVEQASSP